MQVGDQYAVHMCHSISKYLVVTVCQDADSSSHYSMLAFIGWPEDWTRFDFFWLRTARFLIPNSLPVQARKPCCHLVDQICMIMSNCLCGVCLANSLVDFIFNRHETSGDRCTKYETLNSHKRVQILPTTTMYIANWRSSLYKLHLLQQCN